MVGQLNALACNNDKAKILIIININELTYARQLH